MEPLLRVNAVGKTYRTRGRLGAHLETVALTEVSFSIAPQKTLALVGESGSGKSTLALCMACLERPTVGEIFFEGRDITALNERERRLVRPQIQLVFQDPANSLNPRWTAFEIVTEPLRIQRRCGKSEMREKARLLLDRVGVPSTKANQAPDEFSGGQRQRLAIARALSLEPKLLILDEALSALDCSVQAQIANLLVDLQASLGLTYLFITHDLAMAAHLADEIAVMHQGRIVEIGGAKQMLRAPQQEITRRLISAVPNAVVAAHMPQVV
jgi:ABC-type oligopeptide transport system ATPase subunit